MTDIRRDGQNEPEEIDDDEQERLDAERERREQQRAEAERQRLNQGRAGQPDQPQRPVGGMQRQIFVRVAELGSMPTEVPVPEGTSIQEVLAIANVNPGLEVRRNAQTVRPTDIVEDGDVLVAMPKIRGGQR